MERLMSIISKISLLCHDAKESIKYTKVQRQSLFSYINTYVHK